MGKLVEINVAIVARFREVVKGMATPSSSMTMTGTTAVDAANATNTADTMHATGTTVNTSNAELSCSRNQGRVQVRRRRCRRWKSGEQEWK